ncbi:putative chitin synthase export chaperone protein [Phaeoacremonium minimum UCRPA7]|uniref:Chitin synthase export chaperone n=1 Tax=Phaeoacremonium minimum (strain UCR-PA7) TaxID=1286976 RepID=R8BIG7_PHAM7|nr:putative chitin synthase export chaperone protein [Phaeoacremonium minimum UCRPA7]EON99123.1 putative chitin synthase export chaperone protein [Phaeoacremonium minimum UCRPA7]
MSFGDFTSICHTAPLPLCAAVGPITSISSGVGIEPDCYARNIELANTIIFQGAASAMHIVALVMTVTMILHVRGKFTAVGRKEITTFFYLYMLLTFMSLIVDAGVVPPGSDPYPYFVSVQNGLASALITCLLINGFVGFQLYEDGTPLSLWMIRLSSLVAFIITFLVSLATFKTWAGLGPTKTIGLFIVLYLLNGVELLVYVVMQILLVTRTLQDRWPLGDITFGIFFFVAGQVILNAFSAPICEAVSHYVDGLFFATTCNLLAVMMVYKYWDSITKEDLEFSVGTRMNNWEVKELLPEDERRATVYGDDPYGQSSAYDHAYSPSNNRYSKY